MNKRALEDSFRWDGQDIPMDAGQFSIKPKWGEDENGRIDYENLIFFTHSPSGLPLYIKEDFEEKFSLVKNIDQVKKVLDNFPEVRYNSFVLPIEG